MNELSRKRGANSHNSTKTTRGKLLVLSILLIVGGGLFLSPTLYAALQAYVYPTDQDVLFTRSCEPSDFSQLNEGDTITVTVDITNNESADLRGFYYSDQVLNQWPVGTISVSVDGSPITDNNYRQGPSNEVYAGFGPHRWALETPQGAGVFSPTHPIPGSGGTARIVYTMTMQGDAGCSYSAHDAWAGWLETTPTGTGVFGYQTVTSIPTADFTASPRFGIVPLTVQFTDLSTGAPPTRTWDFGDGDATTLTGAVSAPGPTHTYPTLGYYTVTLTVWDSCLCDTLTQQRYIHVTDTIYCLYLPIIMRGYKP